MSMLDDDASPSGLGRERGHPLYRHKRMVRFAKGERVKAVQAFERQAKKRLLILKAAVSRHGMML